jgi:hypothetical protein
MEKHFESRDLRHKRKTCRNKAFASPLAFLFFPSPDTNSESPRSDLMHKKSLGKGTKRGREAKGVSGRRHDGKGLSTTTQIGLEVNLQKMARRKDERSVGGGDIMYHKL